MGYLLLIGPTLKDKDFQQREKNREEMRVKLEKLGIILQEYIWIWDKQDQLKLVIGEYKREEDCYYLQKYLHRNGLKTIFLNQFPV